jgi:hypothetical protein
MQKLCLANTRGGFWALEWEPIKLHWNNTRGTRRGAMEGIIQNKYLVDNR